MKRLVWVLGLFALVPYGAFGQATESATGRVIGEVTTIEASAKQLTVKTDTGNLVTVLLNGSTSYLRVPPGEKDLKKATKIALSDIGVGDRVYARGQLSEDQKQIPARSLIVMTKADLAQKHEADRAEWQKRGVAGTITALNPDTKEITISSRSRAGAQSLVIEGADKATLRRYQPDSVRFSDAKPSAFAELKVGDQVRVLGNKNAEGTRITAEELVSGSFRNIAGTINAIDAASGEIKITDLQTRKPLTVRIQSDSILRRLPPMFAAMMARRREEGSPPGPGGGMMRGGDLQQMLARMAPATLGELKPGDAIIISSTTGVDPARITAITLIAGVEPLFTAGPEGRQPLGGTWSFDIGMPGMP